MKSMYLTPNLYNKLYSYMTYDNVLALRVALETGMRIDDVLSLRAENLKGNTISYIMEKNGKEDRKIISSGLKNQLIKQLRNKRNKREYFFKHRTKRGKHRTRQAVWKNLKQACKKAGISDNITPHSARKTYGAEYFKQNGLEETQKALKHDNVNTTIIYAFSDVLTGTKANQTSTDDMEMFAYLVASKVVEILRKEGVIQ